MWVIGLWLGFLGSIIGAFWCVFRSGKRYGIAQEENAGYEAESKARDKARRIRDAAKQLYRSKR